MELFQLDPGLALWTWITFGILLFILAKFALPGLLSGIKSREELIAKSVDDAEEIEKKLKAMNEEYERTVARANREADEIISLARKEAEQLKDKLTDEAGREADRIIREAKEQIYSERETLLVSMREELADFVCSSSEKIIGTSFTGEKDRDLAKELVKTL